jgi:SAM-dependent methyltransferase
MHGSVMLYVEEALELYDLSAKSVLECGSRDINGSVRSLFSGPYIGLDLSDGPGVDVIGNASSLAWSDASFEVVVSCEMLEHDLRPARSVAEMARVLCPGGYLILTCRGFDKRGAFPLHNEPDLFRYSLEAVKVMVEDTGLTILDLVQDPQCPGVFCTAMKPADIRLEVVRKDTSERVGPAIERVDFEVESE